MDLSILDNLKKKLNIDLYKLLDEVFKQKQIQNTMIEFNQDQLQAGFDALNQKIHTIGGTPYRPYTVVVRKKAGLPTNIVTLDFTGAFYKTFAVRIIAEGYEVIANFEKEDGNILDNIPGEFDLLGLDDEGIAELVEQHVYPVLYILLRKKLGL